MLDKNNAIAELGNIGYMAEVFRKIETENSLNIVYIGGSITQGCNADPEENRYVNLSAKWWNEKFPKADVTFLTQVSVRQLRSLAQQELDLMCYP